MASVPPPPIRQQAIFVATTRVLPGSSADGQNSDRSAELSYLRQAFSFHRQADRSQDEQAPESKAAPGSLSISEPQRLEAEAFANRLAASQKGKKPQIGVFVHGYNTSYDEAVAHVAAMAAGADDALTPVLFAWPSTGRPTGYVADRDAAAFSRDGLAELILRLTADKRLGEITIIAHSMGAWLTVEALRQMRIGGDGGRFSRLRVILAAPDIDIDLFRTQIKKIGPLPNPMILLVSPDDRILRLSGRIGGDRRRLGALAVDDPRVAAGAQDAGLIVVDISAAPAKSGLNHDRYIELANRYKRLASAKDLTLLQRSGTYVFDTGGKLLISSK